MSDEWTETEYAPVKSKEDDNDDDCDELHSPSDTFARQRHSASSLQEERVEDAQESPVSSRRLLVHPHSSGVNMDSTTNEKQRNTIEPTASNKEKPSYAGKPQFESYSELDVCLATKVNFTKVHISIVESCFS
jgi:hypothetical protein